MESRRLVLLILTFMILGCQKPIPQKGIWTGTITIAENKSLPFQMFLDLHVTPPTGYFINGNEQTQIPEIQLHDDSISFTFSEYGAAMQSLWNGKECRGKFIRYRADTNWNEFVASPETAVKEKSTPMTPIGISLAGKFQVYIRENISIDSTTTAHFWIQNDSVFGTLIAPDGDYGLFVGKQNGMRATLARFTGWQAFLMELEQLSTTWNGKLYARSGQPIEFTLVSRPTVTLEPKVERFTRIKNPKSRFTFFGTTSTGQAISNTDERFKGKAILIDIMGTWCHNCMDAAPLLQRLYSDFGRNGFEVVGLAFEISDNEELAKKNLSLFQKRYGITYTLLFCGSTKDTNVELKLRTQLKDFYSYPTTIFVDKRGIVKDIHVGFNGPSTGEGYQQQVRRYYEIVEKIIK